MYAVGNEPGGPLSPYHLKLKSTKSWWPERSQILVVWSSDPEAINVPSRWWKSAVYTAAL